MTIPQNRSEQCDGQGSHPVLMVCQTNLLCQRSKHLSISVNRLHIPQWDREVLAEQQMTVESSLLLFENAMSSAKQAFQAIISAMSEKDALERHRRFSGRDKQILTATPTMFSTV
jgi:hypothetical protein